MPTYVALGLTKQEVMPCCPMELEYVFKAQKLKKRMQDTNNWELGLYIESAVATAVEHNLAGYKARSKYVEEPFSHKADEQELNEKNIRKQRKLIVAKLETLKRNWDLEHPKPEE